MKKFSFLFIGLGLSVFFLFKSQGESGQSQKPSLVKMANPSAIQKETAFFEDGSPKYVYEYLKGLPHGTHKEYFENGQQYLEVQYHNGKRDGWQYVWSSDGKPQYTVQWMHGVVLWRMDFPIATDAKPSPEWKFTC